MKDKSTLIACLVITFIVGVFIGYTLTAIYAKDAFEKEIVVKVTPIGQQHHPYTNKHFTGVLNRQKFTVVFKNGNQVSDSWEGYAYSE